MGLQDKLDAAAKALLIAGIIQIVWGVILLVAGGWGLVHIVAGILMLIGKGKVQRGEGGFILSVVGCAIGLVGFFSLVPLINIWPLVMLFKDKEVREALL